MSLNLMHAIRDAYAAASYQRGQLLKLADAFYLTGNSQVAEQLEELAESVTPLLDRVKKAENEQLTEQLNHSQKMAFGMLDLATNGELGLTSDD